MLLHKSTRVCDAVPLTVGQVRVTLPLAARVACVVMAVPQVGVIASLWSWGCPGHAASIAVLLLAQLLMMKRFLAQPVEHARWYSGFNFTLVTPKGITGGACEWQIATTSGRAL